MFKKDISIGAKSKVKSSAQRAIRAKVCETYPLLAPHIDDIVPKKEQLDIIKIPDARSTLYAVGSTPLFFQHMDDALIPHLSLVHKYPDHFPRLRVDRGAIRFVLSGAALMVPGVVSPGGRLPRASGVAEDNMPISGKNHSTNDDDRYANQSDFLAGTVVVIEAEGKDSACSVGILKMGTKEMKEVKKGVGVENGHYLGDSLWKLKLD